MFGKQENLLNEVSINFKFGLRYGSGSIPGASAGGTFYPCTFVHGGRKMHAMV
jgi:hypothetical protein